MNYLQIFKDGKHYYFPKLTKQHIEGSKLGYWIICDLKNNRDLIGGQWSKPLKIEKT